MINDSVLKKGKKEGRGEEGRKEEGEKEGEREKDESETSCGDRVTT